MEWSGSGVSRHTTSSTTVLRDSQTEGGATGAATTMRLGWCRCRAAIAARNVELVAIPSSTKIMVWFSIWGRGRSPRYAWSRRSSSCFSAAATCSTVSREMFRRLIISLFNIITPPEAMAPIANSSCPGTPSFRTSQTSRGTWRALAISYATGIPPRGNPRTSTSGKLAYWDNSAAKRRPASVRLWNRGSMILTSRRSTGAM